jgi:hypothetical protein
MKTNTPITSKEVKESNLRFILTGQFPNRAARRFTANREANCRKLTNKRGKQTSVILVGNSLVRRIVQFISSRMVLNSKFISSKMVVHSILKK